MKHITSMLSAALASLILLSSTAQGQNGGLKFSLKDLGARLKDSFSAQSSTANGINNRGDVTGNLWVGQDQECFYWGAKDTKPTVFYFLTRKFVPVFCDARAVDSLGQVAGSGYTFLGTTRAFRRDSKGGTLTALDPVAPLTTSNGLGIYNGTVVGYMGYYFSASWDANGAVTNLFPTIHSQAFGLNATGQAIGFFLTSQNSLHAFSGISGSFTDLGTLGGNDSLAYAINASGIIVGQADVPSGGCVPHLAYWVANVATDLGACGWSASAISSDNWIVGYQQVPSRNCSPWQTSGDCRAFLATLTPNCIGPYDLNTLLDSSGAGWTLVQATGINDSHQIVGFGITPKGETHAFVLTPNNQQLCYPD